MCTRNFACAWNIGRGEASEPELVRALVAETDPQGRVAGDVRRPLPRGKP
jgi:hypothetical protein